MECECGSFKRNSSVAPFSLFFSFFFFFVASLALSIYLSFVLFGIFSFVLFGIFSALKGNTLCFTRIKRRSSHFIRSTQHKDKWKLSWCMQMYASASVAGYAMILARHVAIIGARPNYHAALRSSKSMYDTKIKSWDGGCCMAMYHGKAMEMP